MFVQLFCDIYHIFLTILCTDSRHSKESTRLRNIYTAVRYYYYCILWWR